MALLLVIPFVLGACGEEKKTPPPGGPVTTAGPATTDAPGSRPVSTQTPTPSDGPKPGGRAADAPPAPPSPSPAPGPAPEPTPGPAPAPDAPATAEPAKPEPIDLEQACDPAADDAPALTLGKLQLTSGLEDKKPVDELKELRSGQKLYAYLEVGSKVDDRCVAVRFRFGDRERATLKLNIGRSPRWRTWAHVTAGKRDVGKTAEVTVYDDQGHELLKKTLPVVAAEK